MSEMRTFSGIKKLSVFPAEATFLLVSKPSLIPHISLGIKGAVHSLSVNGYSKKLLKDLLPALNRKKIPYLVVVLNAELSEEIVIREFSRYSAVETDLSCLVPVRNSLAVINDELKSAGLIFRLLHLLDELQLVKEVLAVNMDEAITSGSFTFSDYNSDDVKASIDVLLRNKKEASNV